MKESSRALSHGLTMDNSWLCLLFDSFWIDFHWFFENWSQNEPKLAGMRVSAVHPWKKRLKPEAPFLNERGGAKHSPPPIKESPRDTQRTPGRVREDQRDTEKLRETKRVNKGSRKWDMKNQNKIKVFMKSWNDEREVARAFSWLEY